MCATRHWQMLNRQWADQPNAIGKMKIARVLVVEDESAIAELISVNLRHAGMLAVLAARWHSSATAH